MPPEQATVGDLAIDVLQQQTAQLMEHSPGARGGRDPRAVHQMRVATRRLRAALRLFADILPAAQAEHLDAELKWVAGQLGHVRDLDVQLRRLRETATELQLESALAPYVTWLEDQRREAQQTLEAALNSARFMDLVEALRSVSTWTLPEAATAPLRQQAALRLERVFKTFRKRATRLRRKSPLQAFHKVRIRAKRLRYAAEFFQPIFGQPASRFIKRLTKLQDILGELQDSVVSDERIRDAVTRNGASWPIGTTLALGQILEHEANHRERLKRRFQKRYEDVAGKAWRRLESNVAMS
jgi:CHAD domain-containing protein